MCSFSVICCLHLDSIPFRCPSQGSYCVFVAFFTYGYHSAYL